MSSEVFRSHPQGDVTPVLWRVVNASNPADQASRAAALLDQRFQEGRQQGISETAAAARLEADKKIQPVIERMSRSIEDLASAAERVREQTAADLVRLSIAIAARILHRETTIDPGAVLGLIRAAFEKVQAREVTRIKIHPSLDAAVRGLLEESAAGQRIEIDADPALRPGDILVDTTHGLLDASVDTQLAEIKRGLADRLDD